jgi:hypothetical protein
MRGHISTRCWHRFLKKHVKRGKIGTTDEKIECNRPIEEREGRSARSTDGQKGSTLTVGQWVRAIGRWQTRGSADRHEEGGIQRNSPDGKYGGEGSVHGWRRVKSPFLEGLRLLKESFYIFSSFCR